VRPERDGAVASRGRGAAQRMPPAVSGDTQGRSSVLGHVCCMEDGGRLQSRWNSGEGRKGRPERGGAWRAAAPFQACDNQGGRYFRYKPRVDGI